ncbi:protein of unknown function DUF2296 [Cynara cardunculus var. scolymus]|uniref:Protein transport protein SEC23 n=1 Tax=Cynara cardunculus var. scolymus TaxID=59895 RepID=A0A103XBN3_CYNCS|nr:protein of unknown function DUF2296 [Cynara cardunculus var. scolymus]
MDFVELEAIEGLRWSWNSWPVSKTESNNLVIPLSIMQTPLMKFNELPLLSYDPLICSRCGSVLNPYARVDYPSRIWVCPFCYQKNSFPRSYAEIGENNIPAELFPTYSTVEYQLGHQGLMTPTRMNSNRVHNWGTSNGLGLTKSNSCSFSSSSLSSLDQRGLGGRGLGIGPVFVFVVDASSSEDELQALKNELLLIVAQLPENAMVGLIVFDSMVRVYDLGFTECLRMVVFHGERKLSTTQGSSDPIILEDIDESNEWLMGRMENDDEDDDLVFIGDDLTWDDVVGRAFGTYKTPHFTRASRGRVNDDGSGPSRARSARGKGHAL